CWMTAFGPATESCTYILIIPSLTWSLLQTWLEPRPPWMRATLILVLALLVLAQLSGTVPYGSYFRDLGPQPFAALLFLFYLAADAVREVRWPTSAAGRRFLPAPAHAA